MHALVCLVVSVFVSCPFPTPRSHLSSLRLEVVVVEPEGELRRVSGRLHTHTPSSQTHHNLHETEIRQEGRIWWRSRVTA